MIAAGATAASAEVSFAKAPSLAHVTIIGSATTPGATPATYYDL